MGKQLIMTRVAGVAQLIITHIVTLAVYPHLVLNPKYISEALFYIDEIC